MKDLQRQTVEVYDQTAQKMAKKFRRLGARVEDIERAFQLAGNPENARVVEIGCGDGRDAKEICERAGWYLGFDPAPSFIKIAQEYVPKGHFEIGDALNFDYPKELDIVFAFASLLHSEKAEVQTILRKVYKALKPGGIFYISLKWAKNYTSKIKKDEFGERQFYFYTPELIAELAGENYQTASVDRQMKTGLNHPDWFTIALKKNLVLSRSTAALAGALTADDAAAFGAHQADGKDDDPDGQNEV